MTDLEQTLAARKAQYGDFTDHARIAQDLKQIMIATPRWKGLSADKKEALDMIQHKIARVLNGDPEITDSWLDMAGYAKLAADRVKASAPLVPAGDA